ncbi:hypothetical protein DL771_003671 [Monosporascus sp. 5C6A]|nr:hypothetical protein DL771_003671 [Monosporascus sp. 5C6A]
MDSGYHRVHENDTSGEDRTSGSPAHLQGFEARRSKIESGDGSGDDVHSQERSSLAEQTGPASRQILETQQSKTDFWGGSNGDEVVFVRSQKRKRLSSAEQNRPTSSEIFEAQQNIVPHQIGPGDRVVTNSAGPIRNDHQFSAYQRFSLTTQELTSKAMPGDRKIWRSA